MKSTTLALVLVLVYSCSINNNRVIFEPIPQNNQKNDKKPKNKPFLARITYWSPEEPNYHFGRQIASDPKKQATEANTVAIDPSKIKYGTKLFIPKLRDVVGDGYFVAEDTGSAVKKMRAIPKTKRNEVNHVIDIYVANNAKMHELAQKMPHYMEVYVYEN